MQKYQQCNSSLLVDQRKAYERKPWFEWLGEKSLESWRDLCSSKIKRQKLYSLGRACISDSTFQKGWYRKLAYLQN